MSDKPDQILRRLEETQKALEAAHADYLKANSESQRALGRVLDAFTELSRTVQVLVTNQNDAAESSTPPGQGDSAEEENNPLLRTGMEQLPRREAPPQPETTALSKNPNNLPARLHSRGVSVPAEMATELPAPSTTKPRSRPLPSRSNAIRLESPTLSLAPASGEPFPALQKDKKIVVTNDGFGVAPLVTDMLASRGYRVRLEGRRPELAVPADLVIFLGSLRSPANLDDAMAVVDDAMAAAEKMSTRLMQPGAGFVALVDTAGGFGLDQFDPVSAPFGALLGLIRLIKSRYPNAGAKLIDLDGGALQAETIARQVVDELLAGGNDSPVAISENRRCIAEWTEFQSLRKPADWLLDEPSPLIYMPGPEAILSTAVERLAIAHELPVAILRRRGAPGQLVRDFGAAGVDARSTDYDLHRLFSVMDFLDRLRSDHGPITAIVAESFPANRDDLPRWDLNRPLLDEFNALLAMTINDPLQLLAVGIGPQTPQVVASALRYFARAESLRRNEYLQVRLAHINRPSSPRRRDLDPRNFALTEFLSAAEPSIAEVRINDGPY